MREHIQREGADADLSRHRAVLSSLAVDAQEAIVLVEHACIGEALLAEVDALLAHAVVTRAALGHDDRLVAVVAANVAVR